MKEQVGFGYRTWETGNHFYVVIPADKKAPVEVYERFQWDEDSQKIHARDVLKLKFSRYKWGRLVGDVTNEFNTRLKAEKLRAGKFSAGGTPLEKRMGKELMVLLWALENSDPVCIPAAVRNWLGLRPEERWWLYTMTNASTGHINDNRRGWRAALRYALCDNPVDEMDQIQLFDDLEGTLYE